MGQEEIKHYQLWKKYKEKGDMEARRELILSFLTLVKYHAGRINLLVPDFIDRDDLESFGVIGLIEAVEKFDYTRGIEFSTYASKRIKGAIFDHLRNLDWLPDSVRRRGKKVKKTVREMTEKNGERPALEELEKELSLSREKIKQVYQQMYSADWLSLFQEMGEGQLKDFLVSDKMTHPEDDVTNQEAEKVLAEALEKLSKQQYLVISLYYFEEMTQKEIAETLDLSPARVSQIHKKAIYRLRGFLGQKKGQLTGI